MLLISGEADDSELEKQWRLICDENAKQTGDRTLSTYQKGIRAYGKLVAEYELVKLYIMKLTMVVDYQSIDYLKSKGYKIDLSCASGYSESLSKAMLRSGSVITRVQMKLNELRAITNKTEKENIGNIEDTIARISTTLGFTLNQNITLASFNAYRKVAIQKLETTKQQRHART